MSVENVFKMPHYSLRNWVGAQYKISGTEPAGPTLIRQGANNEAVRQSYTLVPHGRNLVIAPSVVAKMGC
jgi:hypothetical protein